MAISGLSLPLGALMPKEDFHREDSVDAQETCLSQPALVQLKERGITIFPSKVEKSHPLHDPWIWGSCSLSLAH